LHKIKIGYCGVEKMITIFLLLRIDIRSKVAPSGIADVFSTARQKANSLEDSASGKYILFSETKSLSIRYCDKHSKKTAARVL
jgi:hypothetical protein